MDSSVLWSVREGTPGGVITSSGVYTAPAEAGIYHVIVASGADTERTAVATVTVPIVVALTPASIKTTLLRPVTFTASVNSSQNPDITWSIQEGSVGGTITSDGTYTPPDHAGIFHIVATSVADNKQQSIATVTVEAGGATGEIQ